MLKPTYLVRVGKLSRDDRVTGALSEIQNDLLKGAEDFFTKLENEVHFYFGIGFDDYELLHNAADKLLLRIVAGDTKELFHEDVLVNDALEAFRGAINQLCGGNYAGFSRFLARSSFCTSELITLKQIGREMPHIEKTLRKRSAGNALSKRPDQQLKQPFIDFCKGLIETGQHVGIRTLDDLLNTGGYDHAVTTVGPRTIKAWAKEAGITLKAGRPKKI